MPKPKPLKPRCIKFTPEQEKYIQLTAKAQGHWNFSEVVKRLINREMGRTA